MFMEIDVEFFPTIVNCSGYHEPVLMGKPALKSMMTIKNLNVCLDRCAGCSRGW